MKRSVVIIEDDPGTRELFAFWLGELDLRAVACGNAAAGLLAMKSSRPAAVCLDLGLPDSDGMELLRELRTSHPHVPVVVITSEEDARVGVAAIKAGAQDYLVKPITPEAFDGAILSALQRHELEVEVRALRTRLSGESRAHGIVGQSTAMLRLASQIGTVLDADVPVLLQGETGTGKELVARMIHANGPRSRGPFVPVNCGAIPKDLQESHFFGHERGAFTGADRTRRGFFEEASGGVIFLDEIAELTPEAQVTLLRVLEERRVRRVGGERDLPVDVRVISATHRDLQAMVAAGAFREDLFFRLVVYPIALPPLRERADDVPLLVGHFLREHAQTAGLAVPEISDAALRALASHSWPGNVRELQNAVQFALLAAQGGAIEPEHLPAGCREDASGAGALDDGDAVRLHDAATGQLRPFADLEQEILVKSLAHESGNMTRTAQRLGIGRATLYRKLRDHLRSTSAS